MRRAALAALLWPALAVAVRAQAVGFEADVLPILRDHCFRCHRGEHTDEAGRVRRPKGGLRLDGAGWIEKGGKNGSVVVAGRPDQSPLYTRTVLPRDHDDRMPAAGDPLPAAQAEVLRRWIEGGAVFGAWTGEAGPAASGTPPSAPPPSKHGAASLDLARVAEGLAPLAEATVKQAAGGKARVTPLWHGSALLRVEFAGAEDEVGDAEVAALSPLAEHIGVLVLARTKVTDAACNHLAQMRRLVRLDLRETRITDAGLLRLGQLPELRAVNLFATDVGDSGLATLAALPKLAELRVWQSRATEKGVAKLKEARPDLDVVLAPDLPEPSGDAPQGARGRRRGR